MNFKWNLEKCTLLLSVPKPEMDSRLVSYAAENGYAEKAEFHVSIISFQNGKKIVSKFGQGEELFEKIRKLADEFSWNIEYGNEYFEIEKFYDQGELEKSGYENVPEQTRRTIVQKVSMPDIADFYSKLSTITGIEFEIPFSHLTLFSWCDYEPMKLQGIGLYSKSDFEKYKKQEISF